jgi:hypothetical protein
MPTDPLSLVFLACFLFGLLFLAATALMGNIHGIGGGHHAGGALHHIGVGSHHAVTHVHAGGTPTGHANHHHTATHGGSHLALFSYVNPTSIVLFLLGFGFFGYVFKNTSSLALPLLFLVAAISGFIITALLLALIGRLFGNSEATTIQDVSDRTGLLGKVGTTIQENGLGEILYVSPGGMRKSIPARSVDGRRLERDQEVVVVNYQHGIAEVDTWEHFVNQEEPESLSGSGTSIDELATLRALLEENKDISSSEYALREDTPKE